MTAPTRRVTISISVPAVAHLGVGALLTAICIATFAIHFELPPSHAYRGVAADLGLLAGCTTLAYWLWCSYQRGRAEAASLAEDARAAIAEAAEREQRLLGALRDISTEVAENRDVIKELHDAVAEAAGAIEALQDCYLKEGTALVLPAVEGAPHDHALRVQRRPRSSWRSGAAAHLHTLGNPTGLGYSK